MGSEMCIRDRPIDSESPRFAMPVFFRYDMVGRVLALPDRCPFVLGSLVGKTKI